MAINHYLYNTGATAPDHAHRGTECFEHNERSLSLRDRRPRFVPELQKSTLVGSWAQDSSLPPASNSSPVTEESIDSEEVSNTSRDSWLAKTSQTALRSINQSKYFVRSAIGEYEGDEHNLKHIWTRSETNLAPTHYLQTASQEAVQQSWHSRNTRDHADELKRASRKCTPQDSPIAHESAFTSTIDDKMQEFDGPKEERDARYAIQLPACIPKNPKHNQVCLLYSCYPFREDYNEATATSTRVRSAKCDSDDRTFARDSRQIEASGMLSMQETQSSNPLEEEISRIPAHRSLSRVQPVVKQLDNSRQNSTVVPGQLCEYSTGSADKIQDKSCLEAQKAQYDIRLKESTSTSSGLEADNPMSRQTPRAAKFFVLKSFTEADVHKALEHDIWSSTETGNTRLDRAWRISQDFSMPVFLFFSVNTSGRFCALAELTSGMQDMDATIWTARPGRWRGHFRVKWLYIKDILNKDLRGIKCSLNMGRPVTNSRDTQELEYDCGIQLFKKFQDSLTRTSIL